MISIVLSTETLVDKLSTPREAMIPFSLFTLKMSINSSVEHNDTSLDKCRNILEDRIKFRFITRNSAQTFKKYLNSLIAVVKGNIGAVKFDKIMGDYAQVIFMAMLRPTSKETH